MRSQGIDAEIVRYMQKVILIMPTYGVMQSKLHKRLPEARFGAVLRIEERRPAQPEMTPDPQCCTFYFFLPTVCLPLVPPAVSAL